MLYKQKPVMSADCTSDVWLSSAADKCLVFCRASAKANRRFMDLNISVVYGASERNVLDQRLRLFLCIAPISEAHMVLQSEVGVVLMFCRLLCLTSLH